MKRTIIQSVSLDVFLDKQININLVYKLGYFYVSVRFNDLYQDKKKKTIIPPAYVEHISKNRLERYNYNITNLCLIITYSPTPNGYYTFQKTQNNITKMYSCVYSMYYKILDVLDEEFKKNTMDKHLLRDIGQLERNKNNNDNASFSLLLLDNKHYREKGDQLTNDTTKENKIKNNEETVEYYKQLIKQTITTIYKSSRSSYRCVNKENYKPYIELVKRYDDEHDSNSEPHIFPKINNSKNKYLCQITIPIDIYESHAVVRDSKPSIDGYKYRMVDAIKLIQDKEKKWSMYFIAMPGNDHSLYFTEKDIVDLLQYHKSYYEKRVID